MRFSWQIRVMVAAAALLAVGERAAADTIVLKNGRRITALSAVQEGDKVRYMTAAGELSLPISIVDHIEKGATLMSSGSQAADAANLAIAPPTAQSTTTSEGDAIERGAVHDGAVDRSFITHMETEASGGSREAALNAALAHHAAASFEILHGDMEHALTDEQTALNYAPDEPVFLMNVAYVRLRRSEFKQSLDYLERARRVAPDSTDVAKLEGWAYYGMNKLDEAVAEWKKALALRPDAEVKAALEKAERDKKEEDTYKENESSHFKLRYNGAAEPALARDVLRTLEGHFAAIESELNFSPPESIGVILYTQQAFEDITRAPAWAGALNDGRIRVPVQGLTAVDAELSRVLKHELTHSFVQQKTHGRAPTWIQEGLAQWMEGARSSENALALAQIYTEGKGLSLGRLEGSWTGMNSDAALYAYAWALANIEYIVQSGGMSDLERILDKIGSGVSAEQAIREVLRSDYTELMQGTAGYLRKAYGR